jgi:hypothetical protein
MSLFVPLKRATLLIPSGPSGDVNRRHLFTLLTDPYPDGTDKSSVLLVSIATVRPNVPHDPSCILYPGDHEFVKRNSYVVYQKARLEEANKLLRGVNNGELVAHVPMDGAVFARVCKGLEESRLTPAKFLVFYRNATARC